MEAKLLTLLFTFLPYIYVVSGGATPGKPGPGNYSVAPEKSSIFQFLAEHPEATRKALNQILAAHGLTRDKGVPTVLHEEECEECIGLFTDIRTALTLGWDFEQMRPIAIEICNEARGPIAGPITCEGHVDVFGPHIVDIVDLSRPTPVLEMCQFIHACPRPLPNDTYTAPVKRPSPSPPGEKRDPTIGSIRLAHLTDVHVDEQYFTGAAVDCGLPVCCRDYWNGTGSAREWGEYSCNAPPRTIELILQKVAELEPDIVIYTGDSPPHSVWEETLEIQLAASRFVAEAIEQFIPGVPGYTTIGNHETFPTNYYYRPLPETETLNEEFIEMWGDLSGFGPDQIESIMKAAYFSILARPGLRVIGYNSNYGGMDNWYNILNRDNDDLSQMADFLYTAFQEAENNGDKVIFLGHHPSIETIWEFGGLIHDLGTRFGDIITLHLLGHVHNDRFHVIVDDTTGEARSVENAGVSLDPGPNPGFKMFYLDEVTYEVLDYDHYNIDLLTADGDSPEIELYYRATEEYGMTDLFPTSWLDLTFRFEEDDDLFQKYQWNKRGRLANFIPCTGDCKTCELCSLRNTSGDRFQQCIEATLGHECPKYEL